MLREDKNNRSSRRREKNGNWRRTMTKDKIKLDRNGTNEKEAALSERQ